MTKRKTQPIPGAKPQARDVKSLEKKIKELEAQLCQETLRADFYDEMINVAEAKFNIPIRKKLAPNGRKPACKDTAPMYDIGSLQTVWCIKAGLFQAQRGISAVQGSAGGSRPPVYPQGP